MECHLDGQITPPAGLLLPLDGTGSNGDPCRVVPGAREGNRLDAQRSGACRCWPRWPALTAHRSDGGAAAQRRRLVIASRAAKSRALVRWGTVWQAVRTRAQLCGSSKCCVGFGGSGGGGGQRHRPGLTQAAAAASWLRPAGPKRWEPPASVAESSPNPKACQGLRQWRGRLLRNWPDAGKKLQKPGSGVARQRWRSTTDVGGAGPVAGCPRQAGGCRCCAAVPIRPEAVAVLQAPQPVSKPAAAWPVIGATRPRSPPCSIESRAACGLPAARLRQALEVAACGRSPRSMPNSATSFSANSATAIQPRGRPPKWRWARAGRRQPAVAQRQVAWKRSDGVVLIGRGPPPLLLLLLVVPLPRPLNLWLSFHARPCSNWNLQPVPVGCSIAPPGSRARMLQTRPRPCAFALCRVVWTGAGLANGPAAQSALGGPRAVASASRCCLGPLPTTVMALAGAGSSTTPRPRSTA